MVLDVGALDLVGGLVALEVFTRPKSGAYRPGGRSALAGMKIFCGKHDIKFAVDVDDIALAER